MSLSYAVTEINSMLTSCSRDSLSHNPVTGILSSISFIFPLNSIL